MPEDEALSGRGGTANGKEAGPTSVSTFPRDFNHAVGSKRRTLTELA